MDGLKQFQRLRVRCNGKCLFQRVRIRRRDRCQEHFHELIRVEAEELRLEEIRLAKVERICSPE